MSTNGTGTPKDKSKNKGDVDLNNTKRGVWLVKVGNVYEKYGFELSVYYYFIRVCNRSWIVGTISENCIQF